MTPSRPDHHPGAPDGGLGASPPGATWNGGVAAPFHLEPGASTRIRVQLAWHFPHRYVDFTQFGPARPEWGPTRFWLGNHYALAHADAVDVARTVESRWDELVERTSAWTSVLAGSSLPADAVEHLAAQAAFLRSPSCFRGADGRFFGFEGVNGASTLGHAGDVGGSCPLNCTHVWTYAQAVAALFPGLERSMRETEFDVMQAPDGSVPHRVIVPTYLPQLWDVRIGGPDEPALDGMLGAVLKTYREVRASGDLDWLRRYWPRVRRLVEHVRGRWDPSSSGVLRGIQPSTHDIDLCGVNPFIGSLWLAALRALEELALLMDEPEYAREHRELFDRGSAAYDELMWNGEYYQQVLEPGDDPTFQWETGCLADQLIGQWWAHQLDLGHVLPRENVVAALRSVVRHNLRRGFDGFEHPYRVFADGDDTGLLMCTWPSGGRPEVPTRYCDEVWTGSEYQVAAACLAEGLEDEGWAVLRGVWGRYDGRRRNPYNEIECGDHYVRAMAGWSVLTALTGARWNAVDGTLRLRLPDDGASWPITLGAAWGRVSRSGGLVVLDVLHGAAAVRRCELTSPGGAVVASAAAASDLTSSSEPLVVRLEPA
ncbi:GH116 family glycosyl hydrolase [Jiangella endophytica]|uniref:GH116 family glycosyl hydrolase n=1 Tax=Jiangella endophytica TaxID=1623398 RepID=UPI000E343ECB|nr:GH116 family glycosyl hydrolase [Jiangella endophytica]